MNTIMDPSIFAGVLFCFVSLDGVVGHPMPNQHIFTPPGYSFMQAPFYDNQHPSSQNLVISQPSQQLIQYSLPSITSDSTSSSSNNDSQFRSGTYQPLLGMISVTSTGTANTVQPAEYHVRKYPQSDDQEPENHQHEDGAYQEEHFTEEPRDPQQTPDEVEFKIYDQPELSADSSARLGVHEEEETQNQLPMYVAEFLKNYFMPEEREQPEDGTTKYELIFPTRKATSPTDVPQGSLTRKKSGKYETLQKPHLPTPLTPEPEVLPIQHRNYPISHPAKPEKYVQVDSHLYLNPELHPYLYSASDHSIHDSAILPVAKAAMDIEKRAAKTHRVHLARSHNDEQEKSVAFERELDDETDGPSGNIDYLPF